MPGTLDESTAAQRAWAAIRGHVPPNWTIDSLIEAVALLRGRPIDLQRRDLPESAQAFSLSTADRDVIVIPDAGNPAETDEAVAHCVGHLVMQHPSASWSTLLPDLDPALVAVALDLPADGDRDHARCEQEASEFAGLVLAARR